MKLKVIPFTGWTPTKIFDHDQCPLFAQLKWSHSLCGSCFKGSVPWEGVCSNCGVKPVKPGAMARGIEIGAKLDEYLIGKRRSLVGTEFSRVRVIAKQLRDEVKAGLAKSELTVVLTRSWEVVSQYTKNAWGRVRLDVLRERKNNTLNVVDWKSGGIDKRLKQIKPNDNYADQLRIYGLAAMLLKPEAVNADACLIFSDAPGEVDPVYKVPSATVRRPEVDQHKKWLEGRVRPMMSDRVFAPRPGWYCGWVRDGQRMGCPYEKAKGGPCPL